jgi:hypothetical protein
MESCGISLAPSLGETACLGANRRHFDLYATEEQIMTLCANAMRAGRNAGRLNKSNMRPIVEKARSDGCRAVVTESPHCICDDE